ncbi:MAG: transporter suffix domain-containing protein [Gammaproteobacteria bacterium]|jgi:hypothetical protein
MSDDRIKANWRIKIAFVMFVFSMGWVVVLPLMPLLGFSATAIATFSGVMVVLAEILLVAGATIAGKDGFAYIKARVFGFLKAYGPPETVSRTRYSIGLVLFALPLFYGWISPYAAHFLSGLEAHTLSLAIAGDVLLLISLIMLGGDFWEKLRSLFIHSAHAVIPGK